MTLSADEIDKMKVADLKAELSSRGLDTKGLKKDLAERLKAAVESEVNNAPEINEEESNEAATEEEAQEDTNDTAEMQEPEPEQNNVEQVEDKHEEPATEPEATEEQVAEEPAAADISATGADDSTAAVYGGKDETMAELDETIKAEPEATEEKKGEENVEVKKEADATTEENKEEVKQDKGIKRKREEPAVVFDTVPLDEPEFDKDALVLDWYNSDLHLQIDRETLTKASPLSTGGFAYMWAGARSTFGIRGGKVAFEVKITEENDTKHLVNEVDPHVLRIGFSTDDTSMQLGEEPMSYGYGGTGKKSVDLKFSNYGVAFGLNDVITAYLEMNDNFASISYAKNGEYLGEAFRINGSELGEKALFPHILTKNYQFECNFGQLAEPWFPVKEGFTFINQVPVEERIRGSEPPASRNDCEMIMLIGLPGSGKTTWASKYALEHPEKKYNILGTNALIDKMKVAGLNRKRNYAGRWDQLIQKCTDCLNRLLVLAAKRRRNYILDQTNVYPSARRRKLKCYGDFIRRAVVIVPAEEEFKRRVEKREAEEGKDVPDEAVLEMKANFRLPESGPLFSSIEYPELEAEEAAKLVQQYNDEGVKAGYGPNQKKPRLDDRRGGQMGDKRGPPMMDRRRDHRRVDSWGGRSERDRPSRFDDRRGPRDQRRSFEGPPRREPGFGGRMPPGPPAGRYGGYPGYGAPAPRGGPPPRRGGFGERDRGYGGGDYYRGGDDYYRGGGGDYSRSGSGGYSRGGSGGDFRRGGGGGADRRTQPSVDRRASGGSVARPAGARPREAGRTSWDQGGQQQQSWGAQPTTQAQTTATQWGQQGWNQSNYSYDPATYSQYQQGYWNGQSYDYSAAWQQQQQMYYQQTSGQSGTGAGAQATQQGTWKSY